ncbi:IucA/IucC family protein [Chengkuizengella marina]|uniref:IucA/IucC family siderophore biosynthesis protein n=1 Tax=Chengkuizengella marina TaxID=2507566 RepID=A0A6N9Q5I1_9BACL|nr:IucA/IucC family siderophore biosynthesis protein [Chengkuizengella marina]NBI29894.1 IucA/IucC family siderophore biosynthesis protein [Chengkuizengella marina]
MLSSKQIAEKATMQSFFNCYLKETNHYEWDEQTKMIRCPLQHVGGELIVKVEYFSLTGRHLFDFPVKYETDGGNKSLDLDYVTLISLLCKELTMSENHQETQDELMLRVIQSCQQISRFVEARNHEFEDLFSLNSTFIETEQALLFGHLLHPTPKSRQGFSEEELPIYSPEMKGRFSLHYFRAHRSIVEEDSAVEKSAIELIKNELLQDPEVQSSFKQKYCQTDDYALIPIHPWQAQYLLEKPQVKDLISKGELEYLGSAGTAFYATSSLRSVYHPRASMMYKLSLNIKITNSLRVNKRKELERGVEVKRLLDTEVGKEWKKKFPHFEIITDPAYLTIRLDGEEESGFEVMIRDNPFQEGEEHHVMPIVALGQDHPLDNKTTLLGEIIQHLAKQEGRSQEDVSLDWFRNYLNISLQPLVWLYMTYGIALEAHQQNSIVRLKEGYPEKVYYRDNQGYYFCESMHETLEQFLPGISEKSQTTCEDEIADERFRYYFFFNHLFGIINAFGCSGLIEEHKLLAELREQLEQLRPINRMPSKLLDSLLDEKILPSKGNLLTRFYDMDELVGSLATQSVYVKTMNPLTAKEVYRVGQLQDI